MDTLIDKLKSRKLWAAVVSAMVPIFGKMLGLDEETIKVIVAALCTYIIGQGIADHGKEKAKVEAQFSRMRRH